MGSRTDPHDVVHKVRNIRQFIGKGQRVKVSVFFRGREITHPELGRQMLSGVVDQVRDIAKVDIEATIRGAQYGHAAHAEVNEGCRDKVKT